MTKLFSKVILTTAYLPPLDYFRVICNSEEVFIESCESYQKQSYRNRCRIYGSGGVLPLIVPVQRDEKRTLVTEVSIANTKMWQGQHIKAITSAYRSAPYFEHYFDELMPLFFSKYDHLFEMNLAFIKHLSALLEIDGKISLTDSYVKEPSGYFDFREAIHPKKKNTFIEDMEKSVYNKYGQYHQVFAHIYGFIPNLSILDLLFNEGPQSGYWLKI
jgi:hypothetical protein